MTEPLDAAEKERDALLAWRSEHASIFAKALEAKALALVEYGDSLPDGVTTEAFAEASNLRREARLLSRLGAGGEE